MKILFTGFEPFGGETVNPSWEAVRRLPDSIPGAVIYRRRLPVEFRTAGDLLAAAARELNPDAVLCIGQAGGRNGISAERIAVNLEDAAAPDNAGFRPEDLPVCADGENAYFATVPVRRIAENIRLHGIPAHVSDTAGTFVCNACMYRLLYLAAHEFPSMRGGFLHVPYLPEQTASMPAGTPSMTLENMTEALLCAAETLAGGQPV